MNLRDLILNNACENAQADFIAHYGESAEVPIEQIVKDIIDAYMGSYLAFLIAEMSHVFLGHSMHYKHTAIVCNEALAQIPNRVVYLSLLRGATYAGEMKGHMMNVYGGSFANVTGEGTVVARESNVRVKGKLKVYAYHSTVQASDSCFVSGHNNSHLTLRDDCTGIFRSCEGKITDRVNATAEFSNVEAKGDSTLTANTCEIAMYDSAQVYAVDSTVKQYGGTVSKNNATIIVQMSPNAKVLGDNPKNVFTFEDNNED